VNSSNASAVSEREPLQADWRVPASITSTQASDGAPPACVILGRQSKCSKGTKPGRDRHIPEIRGGRAGVRVPIMSRLFRPWAVLLCLLWPLLSSGQAAGAMSTLGGNASLGDPRAAGTLADQAGAHLWSKRFGRGNGDYGNSVAVDRSGNVVVVGEFDGMEDFGGVRLDSVGGADIFIAKYSGVNGTLQWSKQFGNTNYQSASSVAVDSSGNVAVTGYFYGTMSLGGFDMTSAGGADIFIAKYSANGAHLWSKRFGSTGDDYGASVAMDSSGNVLVTGYFNRSVDFGGGALTSTGGADIFVVKYSGDGAHLWSKRFGSTGDDYGRSVAVDAAGNVAVTGSFQGTVSFGGVALTSAGGADIFVARFSGANGVSTWSRRFGSTFSDFGTSVAMDGSGDVVVTGTFLGTVNFGGGALTSAGELAGFLPPDIFVAKYSGVNDGAHLWSKRFGSTSFDSGSSVAVDPGGNVVVTGYFFETVDFGGGALTSAGRDDIFVAAYSGVDGSPLWSKRFGETIADAGRSVATDTSGNVLVTGFFNDMVDFGGGAFTGGGIFLAKYSAASSLTLGGSSLSFTAPQNGPSPAPQSLSVTPNGANASAWTVSVSTSSGSWLKVSPNQGTGSSSLSVSVDPAGLVPNTYTGAIQVRSSASNGTQSVNVTLVVTAGASTIALAPSTLRFVTSAGNNPAPQTIQVTNSGAGALGWTAATTQGGNWLSINPTTGVAPTTVTLSISSASLPAGAYTGTITFTALASANATNSPQTVTVTLAVGAPVINDGGVVNGASFSRDAVVSPGSLASMFGVNLAKETVVATSLPLPTSLGSVQVLVGGTAAPLFFVSAGQINFQVPVETPGTTVAMAVTSGGVRGPDSPVSIAPEVPGVFTATPGGTGQGAVLNQDFSANSAQNAAEVGSVIQIFATGLGATNPASQTGGPGATSEPFNRTVKTPVVLINGAPAEVLFSALAPGFVSLYQVNARVPAGLAPGSAVTLQIQIGGRSSNTVTIVVKAPN